ncbi:hypothetical protein F4804DRAFT_30418 [Jackrogersella minutella]|nr:hypothetical protein F4804DRAFT_30418 [Jackrogersella minutella]
MLHLSNQTRVALPPSTAPNIVFSFYLIFPYQSYSYSHYGGMLRVAPGKPPYVGPITAGTPSYHRHQLTDDTSTCHLEATLLQTFRFWTRADAPTWIGQFLVVRLSQLYANGRAGLIFCFFSILVLESCVFSWWMYDLMGLPGVLSILMKIEASGGRHLRHRHLGYLQGPK